MPRGKTKSIARRPVREISSDYVASLLTYAEILFKAGMVPKGPGVIARPETVAAIIEVGRDVGLPATQALAWIMLVNGKPSIWGDAALALIRTSGLLAEGYPKEKFTGTEGEDDFTASFAIRRNDGSPERISTFSIADAKTAGLWAKKDGPWKTYPKRQLMWRAKGFACRDEFQDVLCGLIFAEEALDYPNVVVEGQVVPTAPEVSFSSRPVTVEPSDAATVAAADANGKKLSDARESVTEGQIQRMAELRDCLCTAKNIKDKDEKTAAWKEVIAPYGVESAFDLSEAKAFELIEQLGKLHDPFTHPPERAAGIPSAA